jgi:putative FmdB family regulatory protein
VPTYQYACTVAECGHRFEAVQSFTDDALTECPECSGRLRKVFNSVGVVFKGSGFYRTDSREAAKKKDDGGSKDKKDDGSKADKPAGTADKSTSTSSSSGGSSSSTSSSASPSTSTSSAGSAA